MEYFDAEKFMKEDCTDEMKEMECQIRSMVIRANAKGHEEGFNEALNLVRDAIKWFKETHGTQYIIYGEDSFDHLMEMYNNEA